MQKRENFGSRFAVIMAMAGSAIGLGNIWRFPYMVGEGGGAAFIIIYLISTLILSMPIFFSESIIGRCAQSGTIGAMEQLAPGSKWKWLGYVTIISPLILVSYYSVVGGWSFEFMLKAFALDFNGSSPEGVKQMFGNFISRDWAPLICHTIFIGLTCLIVLAGVRKGIEAFSKLTMPVLFILIVLIMFYSVSLPGSAEGLQYMLKPDFSKIDGRCITSAMGQSFFSLSLAGNGTIIYGSYLSDKEDTVSSAVTVAVFDTCAAMLAALVIIPAMATTGAILSESGPGLMFISLPYLFKSMPGGSIVMAVFFVAVLFAGLTSLVNLFEAPIAALQDQLRFSRLKAVVIIAAIGIVVSVCIQGIVSPWMDFVSIYVCPLGAALAGIMFAWVWGRQAVEDAVSVGRKTRIGEWYYPLYKYLFCVLTAAVFILGAVNGGIG